MPDGANMIVLDSGDNVGIALRDIAVGEIGVGSGGQRVAALERIDQGHKIALMDIVPGEQIVRFGVAVAICTAAVAPGCLVHIHNVKSRYLNNDEDHYE